MSLLREKLFSDWPRKEGPIRKEFTFWTLRMWKEDGSSKSTVCRTMCNKSRRTRKPSSMDTEALELQTCHSHFSKMNPIGCRRGCPLSHTHSVQAKEGEMARTSSWCKCLISVLAANVGRRCPISELQSSIWCNHHWGGGTNSLGLWDVWRTMSTKMFINKATKHTRLKQTRLHSSTVRGVLTLKKRDNKEESLLYVVNWWEGQAGARGKRERRRGVRDRKGATVRRFKNSSNGAAPK